MVSRWTTLMIGITVYWVSIVSSSCNGFSRSSNGGGAINLMLHRMNSTDQRRRKCVDKGIGSERRTVCCNNADKNLNSSFSKESKNIKMKSLVSLLSRPIQFYNTKSVFSFPSLRGGGSSGVRRQLPIVSLSSSSSVSSDSSKAASKIMYRRKLAHEMIAEFFGTFIIVQLGTASIMSSIFTNSLISLYEIASVWVIAVIIAIYTTDNISGAHLNPAISLSFALLRPTKQFNFHKLIAFWFAQLLGAMFGSFINLQLYGTIIKNYEMANNIMRSSASASSIGSAKVFGEYITSGVSIYQAFFVEAFGTAVLSAVIFALTHPKNKSTHGSSFVVPMLIGITVGALICILAPLTQCGINPARDFGPRIIAAFIGKWNFEIAFQNWWLYILAPCIGAPIGAAFIDKILYNGVDNDDKS